MGRKGGKVGGEREGLVVDHICNVRTFVEMTAAVNINTV